MKNVFTPMVRYAAVALSLVVATVALSSSPSAFAQAASAADAGAPSAAVADTASAVAAAPAPMAAAPVAKESVDNPYGLNALWTQGDYVARGTLIILALMSMGSWYILVTKLYESIKIAREAKTAQKGFFKSKSINDAAKALPAGSAFRFIADSGLEASEHHEGALTENIDHNSWVSMNVQRSLDDVRRSRQRRR